MHKKLKSRDTACIGCIPSSWGDAEREIMQQTGDLRLISETKKRNPSFHVPNPIQGWNETTWFDKQQVTFSKAELSF